MSCDPQNFGGFADVFYGTYRAKPAAIKRFRINATGRVKNKMNWVGDGIMFEIAFL
jgi:hypothetical protein